MLSSAESPPKHLVCFDFDRTIIVGHSFHYFMNERKILPYQLNEKNQDECLTTCGFTNRALTRAAIQTALANGHLVAITSYTIYSEFILYTLKKLGLSEKELSQINIIAGMPIDENNLSMDEVATRSPYDGIGKRLHIQKAIQSAKEQGISIDNENVILIDDDEENIALAQKDGHKTILVPDRKREVESSLNVNELKEYRLKILEERQNFLFKLNEYIGNFSEQAIKEHQEELMVRSFNIRVLNRVNHLYHEYNDDVFARSAVHDVLNYYRNRFNSIYEPMNEVIKNRVIQTFDLEADKEVSERMLIEMSKMKL